MPIFGLVPDKKVKTPNIDKESFRVQESDSEATFGNYKDDPRYKPVSVRDDGWGKYTYEAPRYSASRAPQYEQAGADAAQRSDFLGEQGYQQSNLMGRTAQQQQHQRAQQFGQAGTNALAGAQFYQGDMRDAGIAAAARGRMQQGQYEDAGTAARNLGLSQGSALMGQGQDIYGQYQGLQGQFLGQAGQAGQAYGQGLAQGQGARDEGMNALQQLRGFYQQGPGPSPAEAQLANATEQNMAQALALSQSGRGGPSAAAQRQAMFQNAATQQQAARDLSLLRAQESDAWRGRQLQAMGMEGQTLSGMRGQDIATAGLGAGAQAQLAGLGLQAGGQGLQGQTALTGLGLQAQGQGYGQQAAMTGLGLQAQGQGLQAQQGFEGLGLQGLGQGQQYNLGMQGLGQQAAQFGDTYGLQAQQQGFAQGLMGNQQAFGQQMQGMSAGDALRQQDVANAMNYEALKSGQAMSANAANAQIANASTTGDLAMLGLLMAASDVRAKTDIQPLSGDMDDLRRLRSVYDVPIEDLPRGDFERRRTFGEPVDTATPGMTGEELDARDATGEVQDARDKARAYAAGESGRKKLEKRQAAALKLGDKKDTAMQAEVKSDAGDRPSRVSAALSAGARGRSAASSAGSDMLRQAPGYEYRYKGPLDDGRKHFGPMAQDLERSEMGRSAVVTGPDGMKRVDTGKLSLANTAASSDQQAQIDRLTAMVEDLKKQNRAYREGPRR